MDIILSSPRDATVSVESVWSYPRPPRVEACTRKVTIQLNYRVIVETTNALRVLETYHPPTIYVPANEVDVHPDDVEFSDKESFCEFKGLASYISLFGYRNVGWFYMDPTPSYEALLDHIAFYPSRMAACYLDDELVVAQDGDFYGGWITSNLFGPFKGAPGTLTW